MNLIQSRLPSNSISWSPFPFSKFTYIVSDSDLPFLIQTNSTFRISLLTAYKDKRNDPNLGDEHSIYKKAGVGINYALPKRGRMNFNFNYIETTFNSSNQEQNSLLHFEMLEGLQVGSNFTWTLQYQQTFKNNLQANITYEGRRSPGFKTVHTGGVQIQLLF